MGLVRVYEPADQMELVEVRLKLDSASIRYFVEGENYMAAGGGLISLGSTRLWIQVDERDVEAARQVLEEDRND
ncbi:MAG: DUF2007 domain-containing protein [Gemmatimonadales bacterium]